MSRKAVLYVYGAEQICASCVNLPSSKDTYEWLEAAISRKFPNQPFDLHYVDIFHPEGDSEVLAFAQKVVEEDMFYPVITLNGEMVAEGNPSLKIIFSHFEKIGYRSM